MLTLVALAQHDREKTRIAQGGLITKKGANAPLFRINKPIKLAKMCQGDGIFGNHQFFIGRNDVNLNL